MKPKAEAEEDWSAEASGAKGARARTRGRNQFVRFSRTNICIHARDCAEGGRTSAVLPPKVVKVF